MSRCCNSAWCCSAATIGSIPQRRSYIVFFFITKALRTDQSTSQIRANLKKKTGGVTLLT